MNVAQTKAELSKLYEELEEVQAKMDRGEADQNEVDAAQQKAKEADRLQTQVEQYEEVRAAAAKGREFNPGPLPGRGTETEDAPARNAVKTTPGELFVTSPEFVNWTKAGVQSGFSGKVRVSNLEGRTMHLEGKDAQRFIEQKAEALPVLGTDAIVPYGRDPDLVRFEEPEILNLRDLFGSLPTSSDTVHFVRHTATGRGAASQDGKGAAKAYLNVTFEPDTVPVQTIAVLSKVSEQDLSDAPRLAGIINGEMSLDVRQETERQLLWGNDTNGQLEGLFEVGIPEFDRAVVGDTDIDTIRRMRTDLRVARVMPNALAIHPLDWESVELTKAEDEHYIWAIVTTEQGPRIWSLRVVEVDSLENPDTGERRMVMGDWARGATVYDRNMIQLAVGFVNDDFEKNLRTLRAEQRLAFAVKRTHAFSYAQTAEPES